MQVSDGSDFDYDVLVVGGGPAGLSAALQLGRSLRSVLVCDDGNPRNGPAAESHGYLTRDGISPQEFHRLGREEVATYGGEFRESQVKNVTREDGGFTSTLDTDETVTSRKVVLATGVSDRLPETDGFEKLWGNGVYHCPYCHGYEVRDRPLGVLVMAPDHLEHTKLIYNLSKDLIVFTDNRDVFDEEVRSEFVKREIQIEEESIVGLNGTNDGLESISLADGRDVPRHALFYGPPMQQHSNLADQLGLRLNESGLVETTQSQYGMGFTSVDGLFVAGDASSELAPSIPCAVADGSVVGGTVNLELSRDAFEEMC